MIKEPAAPSASSSPRARPARTPTSRVDTSGLGAGSSLTEEPAYERVGAAVLNASYMLDGEALARATSESNIIENAIPGVRLTLKGITSSPASVTTTAGRDRQGRRAKKVKALVDAYNAVVTSVARGADREERPDGDHDGGPAEGQAVRRLRA